MNGIYGLFAAPTAATAVQAIGGLAEAATTPFDMLLKAAMTSNKASAVNEGTKALDGDEGLQEQVAGQLQQLLESLGVSAGEQVNLRVDRATGEVSVRDDHPLAGAIEESIRSNAQLVEEIRRLAEIDDVFGQAAFAVDSELRVEVAEDRAAARLEWR
jgi:hypothetical protein